MNFHAQFEYQAMQGIENRGQTYLHGVVVARVLLKKW